MSIQYYMISKKEANYKSSSPLDLKVIDIKKIINFKYIDAKRLISNENLSTLSKLSYNYYEKQKNKNPDNTTQKEVESLQNFENVASETDEKFSTIYESLFGDVIETVKQFGGMKKDETQLKIISELNYESLLSNNISVVYRENDYDLPENYNGLGYLNLLSIIFEIKSIIMDFKFPSQTSEGIADLNLLFIEEPEAHTHPQMQYIFIKNLKDVLSKDVLDEKNRK